MESALMGNKYLNLLAADAPASSLQTPTVEPQAPRTEAAAPVDAAADFDETQRAQAIAETHVLLPRRILKPLDPTPPLSAAKSLIRTCREYGVGLRLDPDGALVVVSNGRAWRSLVSAIEAHVDDIAQLIVTGWDGTDA
jgi:hypothetical protein